MFNANFGKNHFKSLDGRGELDTNTYRKFFKPTFWAQAIQKLIFLKKTLNANLQSPLFLSYIFYM